MLVTDPSVVSPGQFRWVIVDNEWTIARVEEDWCAPEGTLVVRIIGSDEALPLDLHIVGSDGDMPLDHHKIEEWGPVIEHP